MFNIFSLIFTTINALIPGLYTIKALDQQIEFQPSSYQFLLNYWLYYILLNLIASTLFNDWGLVHLGANLIKCWLFYSGENNIVLVNHVLLRKFCQRIRQGEVMILHVLSRVVPQFGDLNYQVHNFGVKYAQPVEEDVSIDGEAIMEQAWNLLRICQSVLVAATTSASIEGTSPKSTPEGTPPKKLRKLRNVKSFTSLNSRQNSHSDLKNIKQERQTSLGYLNKFFALNLQRPPSPGFDQIQQKNRNSSSPAAPTLSNPTSNGDGGRGNGHVAKVKRRSKSGSEYDLGVPYLGVRQSQMQNTRDDERQYQYQQQQNPNFLQPREPRENGHMKQRSRGQFATNYNSHQHQQGQMQPQFVIENRQANYTTQAGSNGNYAASRDRNTGVRGNDGYRVSSRGMRHMQDELGPNGGSGQLRGPGKFDELPAVPTPSMVIK